MQSTPHDTSNEKSVPLEEIRKLCEETKPEALWEALEAKGIDATPGLVGQAIHQPATAHQPATVDATKPQPELTPGLTGEDLSLLGALATRAGGVDKLIHVLSVWKEILK